jgi:membrane protease YdiL (CAAX protease family)
MRSCFPSQCWGCFSSSIVRAGSQLLNLEEKSMRGSYRSLRTVKLPDLALIAFFAGVGEELFFRGWLQSVLASRFEAWLGILIASVIFGLAHYLSPTYAIYAGLTGLYLGVIYQVSGNLYIVMVIHVLYDFIALVYLVKKGKGEETEFQAME